MLYIYQDFELQGILSAFTSLRWVRRYNDVGEFELALPFSIENWRLLRPDVVLYKKDTDEAAFIKDRNIFTDAQGEEKIIIRGVFINTIFNLRVISYTSCKALQQIFLDILNQNFILSANPKRNISNLIVGITSLDNNPTTAVDLLHVNGLDFIKGIVSPHNIGFRVKYNLSQRKFIAELYEGVDRRDVVFSYQFGNVLEQEYWQETSGNRNTCLVDADGVITIVNDNNQGLSRKEIYTSFNSSDPANVTEQGTLFLQSYSNLESIDTVIDNNSIQFKYLDEWDLGDIVTCKNTRWDISMQRNILEIEEYHDTTGRYITVVFGDYIPTLKGKG